MPSRCAPARSSCPSRSSTSRTTRLPATGRLAPVSSALCCRGFLPVEGAEFRRSRAQRASGRLCSLLQSRSAWGTDFVPYGVLTGPGYAAPGRERRALSPFLRPRGSLLGIGPSRHQESQASEVLGALHHFSPVPPDVPSACNGTDPPLQAPVASGIGRPSLRRGPARSSLLPCAFPFFHKRYPEREPPWPPAGSPWRSPPRASQGSRPGA